MFDGLAIESLPFDDDVNLSKKKRPFSDARENGKKFVEFYAWIGVVERLRTTRTTKQGGNPMAFQRNHVNGADRLEKGLHVFQYKSVYGTVANLAKNIWRADGVFITALPNFCSCLSFRKSRRPPSCLVCHA